MSVKSQIDRIKADKEDIRAAIAEKGQSVPATALLSSYGEKIRAIQTGTDTSDATAAAGDILSGKTAYVDGEKVTGTIASRSASSLSASGAAVKVPAGYYPSQVSKSVASATQATPSISVSATGLITASATQSAGYVAAGTKSATKQLTVQAAQTITPGTSAKTAVASGRYTTGAVTVAGDANLKAENIKKGISIFGVDGSLEGGTAAASAALSINIKSSNVSLKQLSVFDGGQFVDVPLGSTAPPYITKGCALLGALISSSNTWKPASIAINITGGVCVGYSPAELIATPAGYNDYYWIIQPTSDQVVITLADADSIV